VSTVRKTEKKVDNEKSEAKLTWEAGKVTQNPTDFFSRRKLSKPLPKKH